MRCGYGLLTLLICSPDSPVNKTRRDTTRCQMHKDQIKGDNTWKLAKNVMSGTLGVVFL